MYKHKIDVKFGTGKEEKNKPKIEAYLKMKLNYLGKWNIFDFANESVYVELKSRRCNVFTYPTTMVGMNKINKGYEHIKRGKKVYFFFSFNDGLYYWELKTDNKYSEEIGGRYDRGKKEISKYCFIDVNNLIKV